MTMRLTSSAHAAAATTQSGATAIEVWTLIVPALAVVASVVVAIPAHLPISPDRLLG